MTVAIEGVQRGHWPLILCVDDEADVLRALKGFLEGELPHARVVTASSAAAGLVALANDKPDVVVSDYRMPVMDGLQFLKAVRDRYPGTPRIMLTAYPDMQLAVDAVNQAQVERFLVKPVEPEALMDALHGVLVPRLQARQREAALRRGLDALGKQ